MPIDPASGAVVAFSLKKGDDICTAEIKLLCSVDKYTDLLEGHLEMMRAYVEESLDMKIENRMVIEWIGQVREASLDGDDILEYYRIQSQRKSYCCCKKLKTRHRVGNEIVDIMELIDAIEKRKALFGIKIEGAGQTSSNGTRPQWKDTKGFKEIKMVGMKKQQDQLTDWLMKGSPELEVISVVGMGGIGKTTLVKKVYNMMKNEDHFNCRSWVDLSQNLEGEQQLRAMLKGFYENTEQAASSAVDKKDRVFAPSKDTETMGKEQLVSCLLSHLQKKFLLVLDNVWKQDIWDGIAHHLPDLSNGSRIIFTSQIRIDVGRSLREHNLKHPVLTPDEAWILLKREAIRKGDESKDTSGVEPVGKRIVESCGRLPLAILAVAGMLLDRNLEKDEWEEVLKKYSSDLCNNPLYGKEKNILSAVYNDLLAPLKHCFLYCSLFPKSYEIKRKVLIRLWMAEGFIKESRGLTREDLAETYLNELIGKNLMQVASTSSDGQVRACRVHNVIWELALAIAAKENFGVILEGQNAKQDDKTRRLAIHRYHEYILDAKMKRRLRSFLALGVNRLPPSLSSILPKLKKLRVLDLGGVRIEKLPKEIGNFIFLSYIGLRNTLIQKLPKSLQNLQRLETLDARGSKLVSLPKEISALQHLSHLLLRQFEASSELFWFNLLQSGKFSFYDSYVPISVSLRGLRRLKTLKHVRLDGNSVNDLGELISLEKLKIQLGSASDGNELWSSLQKLKLLQYLDIFPISQDNPISVGLIPLTLPPQNLSQDDLISVDSIPSALPPPNLSQDDLLTVDSIPSALPLQNLRQLRIGVLSKNLLDWICSLKSLRKLVLFSSAFTHDPLKALQSLPNLEELMLFKAYNGTIMGGNCIREFPKLRTLFLLNLENLESWEATEERSMRSLNTLFIVGCKKLKRLDKINPLKKLHIGNMPEKFIAKLRSNEGEDCYKVQHIPQITEIILRGKGVVHKSLKKS
ncbi:hypothetical protein AMTR_s00190p00029950 [Amborella trichopoda]|uniref:NB-ARC domain-containing protein n=1 Tax=Amborella trichopoda TaxID=13333 RepID=U5DDF8_AMBTC|nr:hypothetical protein AMTR_s00190p00029950 [Amborella trichopoda]